MAGCEGSASLPHTVALSLPFRNDWSLHSPDGDLAELVNRGGCHEYAKACGERRWLVIAPIFFNNSSSLVCRVAFLAHLQSCDSRMIMFARSTQTSCVDGVSGSMSATPRVRSRSVSPQSSRSGGRRGRDLWKSGAARLEEVRPEHSSS